MTLCTVLNFFFFPPLHCVCMVVGWFVFVDHHVRCVMKASEMEAILGGNMLLACRCEKYKVKLIQKQMDFVFIVNC